LAMPALAIPFLALCLLSSVESYTTSACTAPPYGPSLSFFPFVFLRPTHFCYLHPLLWILYKL
jgi:hypothetical protein